MKSPAETMKTNLVSAAQAFARAKGIRLTSVGMYATKDGGLFDRLANGGMCSAKVYDRVMQWLSNNWPTGTRWPKGVPRPTKTKIAAETEGEDAIADGVE